MSQENRVSVLGNVGDSGALEATHPLTGAATPLRQLLFARGEDRPRVARSLGLFFPIEARIQLLNVRSPHVNGAPPHFTPDSKVSVTFPLGPRRANI